MYFNGLLPFKFSSLVLVKGIELVIGFYSMHNLLQFVENAVDCILASTHLRSLDKKKTLISCVIAFKGD
jgi:hypothetical protein